MRITHVLGLAVATALAAWAMPAAAVDFPVTGVVTMNGHAATLPNGSVFAGSAYNPTTGIISAGKFVVPEGSETFATTFGEIDVTYDLEQTNTSSGLVASDGTAAFTTATFTFTITSMTFNGSPVDLGTCTYGPFDADLVGIASSTVLSAEDTNVSIAPVSGATDCGGPTFQSVFNQFLAGTGSVQLELAGNFTPPPDDDLIFKDGFDGTP